MLDWPDDNIGQIQRDGQSSRKTFFDVYAEWRTDCKMSPDDNGDIKLVPMLEIEAPAQSSNLPSDADLQNYGILRKMALNGKTPIYVPLQVVTDSKTGSRAAFYGKMLYKPRAGWGGAHQVRLAWVVQMLVDVCQRSTGAACDSYVDGSVDGHNQVQVVQTYYDDFKLTGFNVRENRGTDYAIVYEDPAVDTNLNLDTALIPLSIGLDLDASERARLRHHHRSRRLCGQWQSRHHHQWARSAGAPKLEDQFRPHAQRQHHRDPALGHPQYYAGGHAQLCAPRSGAGQRRFGRGSIDPGEFLYAALERRHADHAHVYVRLRGHVPRHELLAGERGKHGDTAIGPQIGARSEPYRGADGGRDQLDAVWLQRPALGAGRRAIVLAGARSALCEYGRARRHACQRGRQNDRQPAPLSDAVHGRQPAGADRRNADEHPPARSKPTPSSTSSSRPS